MSSLYEIICDDLLSDKSQEIEGGGSVMGLHFDFLEKDIRSKGKYLIKQGHLIPQEIKLTNGKSFNLSEDTQLLPSEELDVQKLYDDYIYSAPTRMDNYERGYFRPKSSDELSYDDLIHGKDRIEAKYRLEAFIVLGIISGRLKWENPKNWFWRGNNGLIMYRSWFI